MTYYINGKVFTEQEIKQYEKPEEWVHLVVVWIGRFETK